LAKARWGGSMAFTIMSNNQSDKIAMMIESTRFEEVKAALDLFGTERLAKVKSISCDMSPTYLKVCNEKLPKVQAIIDKFHVMQYVYTTRMIVVHTQNIFRPTDTGSEKTKRGK
jgi:transposase